MEFHFKWAIWKAVFVVFGGSMSFAAFQKYKKENKITDKYSSLGFALVSIAMFLGNLYSSNRSVTLILLGIHIFLFIAVAYCFYKAGYLGSKKNI